MGIAAMALLNIIAPDNMSIIFRITIFTSRLLLYIPPMPSPGLSNGQQYPFFHYPSGQTALRFCLRFPLHLLFPLIYHLLGFSV